MNSIASLKYRCKKVSKVVVKGTEHLLQQELLNTHSTKLNFDTEVLLHTVHGNGTHYKD